MEQYSLPADFHADEVSRDETVKQQVTTACLNAVSHGRGTSPEHVSRQAQVDVYR